MNPIQKFKEIIDSGINEMLVRVYNTKTKEVIRHTLGMKQDLEKYYSFKLFFYEKDGKIIETKEYSYLCSALDEIREYLEKTDRLIVVRGADRNCAASGMQTDMSAGQGISKLEMNARLNKGEKINRSDYIFNVLEDSTIENVTTLAEQKAYWEKWYSKELKNYITKGMKTIWKFELKMEAVQKISLPPKHNIVSVGIIKKIAYMWVEVWGDISKTEKIKILTIPTGQEVPQNAEFVGTLFYKEGEIVQHVYKS
ncbi:hypothetical protein [Bernardetia sp.]|uniref:DUF7352 domain-containing protein n=1 Tax=Bernardetia sp. TaxID=1937974 RepID=UPI0025BA9EC9|nr:hypothetical protein [Bernardetia sp.]